MPVTVSMVEGYRKRMEGAAPPPFDLNEAKTYIGVLTEDWLNLMQDVEILLTTYQAEGYAAAQRRLAERLDRSVA